MIRGLTGPLAAAVERRLRNYLISAVVTAEARVEADIAARGESVYPYLRLLQRLHDEAPTDH